ncbi:hypothetical protein ACJJTC_010666 [Scirpophaga incertulas]
MLAPSLLRSQFSGTSSFGQPVMSHVSIITTVTCHTVRRPSYRYDVKARAYLILVGGAGNTITPPPPPSSQSLMKCGRPPPPVSRPQGAPLGREESSGPPSPPPSSSSPPDGVGQRIHILSPLKGKYPP